MSTLRFPGAPRASRGPRGFTGVEILVVLAVIGILAGTGYAAAGHYRARAAEAAMRQDLVHFVNQQQVLRQRTGSLGTLQQLDDLGFRRSPGVVVEEDRLASGGRRAYLRVRHRQTGQRCSVDYSPFVSNALNRVQCWAGPDDGSATERVGGIEVPFTPPVGTTPVDSVPAVTEPTPLCQAAFAPALEAPADQSLRPGLGGTGVFTLRNPGSSARSYSLGFSSSNPAVVPSATGPESVTVPAGGSRPVAATFHVDPAAQAGQVAVLPLEATDTQCPALVGSDFFSVAAELVLGPLELSRPADVTLLPGDTLAVVWTSTSHTNAPRMMVLQGSRDAGLEYADSAALGRFAYSAGVPRPARVVYRLDGAVNGFEEREACMDFFDAEVGRRAPMLRHECFRVTAAFVPGEPRISAPAPREAGQDELFTSEWTVANTSNAARRFSIAVEVSGDLQVVSAPETIEIPRDGTRAVRVSYRLNRLSLAGTESHARLRVEDVERQYVPPSASTAEFIVRTKLEVCAPTVAAAPADRAELPGSAFAVTWRLKNCTNAPRELALTPGGDTDVTTDGGALTEGFTAFQERAVTVRYRMREQSVHGTESHPTLRANDAGAGTPSTFRVTTALSLCAPTLRARAGVPAQPQMPGTGATVAYTLGNCSNDARTFTVPVASTNPAAVPDPDDPAGVTIPAYGSAAVSFTYGIPLNAYGGAPTDLAVRVQDSADPSLFATDRFTVIPRVIRAAPVLSAFPALTLLPGQSGSTSATVTSQSNVAVRYCFTTNVGAGTRPAGDVVAPSRTPPPCVDIPSPFGTAPLTESVTVAPDAEHTWTNQITVTATDQEDGSLTATQPFVVTAALQLATPTLRVPPTPPAIIWFSGDSNSLRYPTTNRTNARRTLCLSVSTSIPAGLASESDNPICAPIGAFQSHSFNHTLKSYGDHAIVRVTVRVYDQDAPSYDTAGSYLAQVRNTAPVARLTIPDSIYRRKWFVAHGDSSYSPVGTPIVKYIWSWGLPNAHWDGVRFSPGGSAVARDSSAEAKVRRAYDTRFPDGARICLVVVDAAGRRSQEDCKDAYPLAVTRARLQWRYRGWWYDSKDFCWDVPWDNQCPKDHGNARWEVLLNASQGDVPIRRAWATFRVDYWQTDDRFPKTFSYSGIGDHLARYTYAWKGGTLQYDFFSNNQKASGSVENGAWRVLHTDLTAAGGWPRMPDLVQHPLVLNANLGSATGAFDGGPHWVPDDAWVTLYVEDANGVVTSQSGYYNHTRSDWKGSDCINRTSGIFCTRGFERLVPVALGPSGSINSDLVDGTYHLSGSGESQEGRIVDMYWEVTLQPLGLDSGTGSHYQSRNPVLEVTPDPCVVQEVTLYMVDDQGQVGAAFYSVPRTGDPSGCSGPAGLRVPSVSTV